MNKKTITIILAVSIYLLSAVISYFIFSQKGLLSAPVKSSVPAKDTRGQVVFDSALPKTEACPLNGELYSQQQKEWWEKHRPLGIMVENHVETRPQSGLSFADVIYEAVAEGGITRFLAVYYCQDAGIVGPIRSARTYFLDFISEYGDHPLYVHVGGANQPGPADALSQIDTYGWEGYNDMNQFSIGFPTFWRDYNRLGRTLATEHTMYSTTDKLWQYGAKSRDLTDKDREGTSWTSGFIEYDFKDDAKLDARPAAQNVHMEFWSSDSRYFTDWKYDKVTNAYLRSSGVTLHKDKNNDKQLSAKNLVALFMTERSANDGYMNNLHLLYGTKGRGEAIVYMDGKEIKGTWRKDKRTSKTLLFDSKGTPIKLNKGVIWFSILPTDGVSQLK